VTTPQTVSFYLGAIKQDTFVGTTSTGKWLKTYAVCIDNKKINAVAWDNKGKEHVYHSKKKYNNINNFITVIYPDDFAGAPNVTASAFCQIHLFNSSKSYVTLYVKHATADEKITILSPYQSQVFTTHCFNEEYLIAKLMHQNRRGQWVEGQRYKTLKQYTVVNALPFVTFPDNFRETLNYSWD